jgi:hypothetical protein
MKVCCSYKGAVTHHQCSAALALAKGIPHCPVLLCKTVSKHVCVTVNAISCSYRCAVPQHQCTASLALAECIPHCPVLLCKTVSQHVCVTVDTPMKICCRYNCALTHQQCTATLDLVECTPHCPVLLCNTGSQQALCHCRITYEGLLLIQVCSDPPPTFCSTGFGKMHSPLSSVALQNSLTACMCHCRHTYEDLPQIQLCIDPPAMHCSTGLAKCIPHCPVLLCKTVSQHVCVTVNTICCSSRCAVTQHQCTHCRYTNEGLLLIQVCSEPKEMPRSAGQGKMHYPLLSGALQNRFTAGTVSVQIHLWIFALHTGVP